MNAYHTTRHFYPNGVEGETMDCTFKSFESLEKAIKYAHRYSTGLRFAGVSVTDDNNTEIYEITSDGDVVDHRVETK